MSSDAPSDSTTFGLLIASAAAAGKSAGGAAITLALSKATLGTVTVSQSVFKQIASRDCPVFSKRGFPCEERWTVQRALRLCHVSYSDRVPSPTVLLDLDFATPAQVLGAVQNSNQNHNVELVAPFETVKASHVHTTQPPSCLGLPSN
jgi:hypothetical protein